MYEAIAYIILLWINYGWYTCGEFWKIKILLLQYFYVFVYAKVTHIGSRA